MPKGEGALAEQCVALAIQGLDVRISVHVAFWDHFPNTMPGTGGIQHTSPNSTANAQPATQGGSIKSIEEFGTLAK